MEDANLKLGNVLSDVFGVSGQLMLEALLRGKATPEEIAELAKCQARKRIPDLIAAMEGHRMNDHHRRMIGYSLEHMRFLEEQITQLDKDIAAQIRVAGLLEPWQLVQSVPGMKEASAANVVAETGGDMSQFPSAKHFGSWGGVCPGNNRSAGKNKSSHTTGGNPWLRSALTECAWAAANKKGCFLKEKFWRITTKSGGKKAPAVIAVAHTLLTLIYQVLTTRQPYKERGAPILDPSQKQRIIRHHVRRLGKLGVPVRSCLRPQASPAGQ
jgi:transposase